MSQSQPIAPLAIAIVISIALSSLVTWGFVSASSGVQGVQGPAGPVGPAGADGADGEDGLDATPVPGPQGAAGAAGPRGATGAKGADGADGADGGASNTSTASIGAGSATLIYGNGPADLFGPNALALEAGFYVISVEVNDIAVTTPSNFQRFTCTQTQDGVAHHEYGIPQTYTNQAPYSTTGTWTVRLTSAVDVGFGCWMSYAFEDGAASWDSMILTAVRLDT